ncbi:CRISPR-associated endonuclease/helicase Cas3 [Allopseudospirillum japonicum]|uniref:CRISPR-associated endonuclease/helicase Cas3 n=1 Tax=Allopseudospirillum japonicum TaxID=64971 RepID=A0A1H6SEW9_9GAMM|nr:CRISPR-associated helicase Cas3' [Allopseudospirillum japonicum]SEI65386.1 CRISPR-associated endonuclease/helicase Cas3 [Allopseudospirillum japonicum]
MARFRSRKKDISIAIPAIPFQQCYAKTWQQPDGTVCLGRSVFNHCQIVGETARQLMALFPSAIRNQLFPEDSELVSASHDIGKVSPSFAAKLFKATGQDYRTLPALAQATPETESQWGGHAGVSQVTAEALQVPKYVAEILGQHHGFNPPVDDKRAGDEIFGGQSWQNERQKLVEALKAALHCDWPVFESAAQARVVAGLTSVADWIGSGAFFEDPHADWQPRIGQALTDAGFIRPKIIPRLSFAEVFDPEHKKMQPRQAQQVFFEQVQGPGVYILEAQMGMGKTEAALYAAYKLLAQGQATGIYFALPTQLTSNKIYDRFNAFLEQIVHPDTPNRALLLHSSAWLLDTEMGEEGRPGGAWFHHKKRGLLAPFAVGTLDQALMAVMNVKHGFVRAFGLAGKVVILDEVHSYDLYTGTILNELTAFLRQIGCTVIILSATLSRQRREALTASPCAASDYPLITAVDASGNPPIELAVYQPDTAPVSVQLVSDDQQALEEALARAEQGQQVLWIENTVAEAQQRYLDLASRAYALGCDISLLHSRFIPADRQRNETRWVNAFGQAGWSERRKQGRILVGTQVLEQSLDIDADFLVSRFAPTDMLLQRIGRLWRHASTPRPETACRECWLIAPDLELALTNPANAFGATASVYAPYVLCRSLEVWQNITRLVLPKNIRGLIDQTYEDRQESGLWSALLQMLKKGSRYRTGEEALESLARLTLSRNGKTLPEHKAETRYSDQQTLDVLLLRAISYDENIKAIRVRLLDDQEHLLPCSRSHLTKQQWRALAATLHQQLVSIKPDDCPPAMSYNELKKLQLGQVFYLGDPQQDEALLRIALVTDTGEIRTLDGAAVGSDKHLEYRDDLGYQVIKHKE